MNRHPPAALATLLLLSGRKDDAALLDLVWDGGGALETGRIIEEVRRLTRAGRAGRLLELAGSVFREEM